MGVSHDTDDANQHLHLSSPAAVDYLNMVSSILGFP